MNAKPHTHGVEFRRSHNYVDSNLNSGGYFVRYGDQTARYAWAWQRPERWSPSHLERKVKRATVKAMSRHDVSSVLAGEQQTKLDVARRMAEEAAKQVSSTWTSS